MRPLHQLKTSGKAASLLLASIAFLPSTSFALVSAQAYLGNRSGTVTLKTASTESTEVNKKTLKNSELGLSLLLDPIPLVPVAFGIGFIQQDFKVNVTDFGFETLEGAAIVPEMQAWLPLGQFKPFIRLGYALGAYKGSTKLTVADTTINYSATLKGTGSHVGVGVKFEPIPLPLLHLAFFGEYSVHSYKFADQSLDATLKALTPTTPYNNSTWNGAALVFGLEAGI